jgi:3-phenylpropionate/trans-cinnamate dioxygenase ferredoxin subunit
VSWTAVCKLSELGDGTAIGVEIDDKPVCVARSEGAVYALHNVCSHAEIALSEGEVEDRTIECWLHGSAFDLATGKPTSLPATKPVPTYAVRVDGDDVFVDITLPR